MPSRFATSVNDFSLGRRESTAWSAIRTNLEMTMFLEEQKANFYDLRRDFTDREPEFVERHVWSPVACRHTSWTYRPLVRHTGVRGRIVPGSRQRCPFIIAG